MAPLRFVLLLALFVSLVPGARAQDILWMRAGHADEITGLLFHPGTGNLITSSRDGTVRVWDMESHLMLRRLDVQAAVTSASISEDGRRFATGDQMGNVVLWNTETWTVERRIASAAEQVLSVGVSPDGESVAACYASGPVRVYSASTGALERELVGHSSHVNYVRFSPDDRWIATAGADYAVRLWERSTGRLVRTIQEVQYDQFALAFSPDSRYLAALGYDSLATTDDRFRGIVVYAVETGNRIRTYAHLFHRQVKGIAFSPDGRLVAAAALDFALRLARLGPTISIGVIGSTEKWEWQQEEVHGPASAITFSPDGRHLVWGNFDGSIRYVRLTGSTTPPLVQPGIPLLSAHTVGTRDVALSPGGNDLVSGGEDGRLFLWEAATGARLDSGFNHTMGVRSVAYSPDGSVVLSASLDGTIHLWNASPLTSRRRIYLSADWLVNQAVMASDGAVFAALGGIDSAIAVVDTSDGEVTRRLTGHGAAVMGVALPRDSRRLASASMDGTVRVWDLASGVDRTCANWHSNGALKVAFTPDGEALFSGGADGVVYMHDPLTGAPYFGGIAHRGGVTAMAVSGDGRFLVTAGADSLPILWGISAETIVPITRIQSYPTVFNGLALSYNGHRLFGATSDATIVAIDIEKLAGSNDENRSGRQHISLSPNPARDVIVASIEFPQPTRSTWIVIHDLLGRPVFVSELGPAEPGLRRIPLRLDQLSSGSYLLTVFCDGQRRFARSFARH